MPTYALGRPLPSPPPCAHGGGGGPESTGKTDRPEPLFLRRCRGRDWLEARKKYKKISGDTFLTLVEGNLARADSRWQHIKNSYCKHPIKYALLEK